MANPNPRPEPGRAGPALRRVVALCEGGSVAGLSDGELLERFAAGGGSAELAFEALVARHGPMVLRACRATLPDSADAQDAFQATFLLLARRAHSLWVRDSLGPWLHSVACRTSAGLRVAEARRRAIERKAAAVGSARRVAEASRDDFDLAALHEEIEALPERFRAPVVLCHLEGLTHEQAAAHLACPVGTVRSRLARGRDRLKKALARRGVAPIEKTASNPPALAAVPAPLLAATIHAARISIGRPTLGAVARWSAPLFERMVAMLALHPLKLAGASLLATAFVAFGLGLGAAPGQDPSPEPKDRKPAEAAPKAAVEARVESMERRIRELEAKLDEVSAHRSAVPAGLDPSKIVRVRSRFDNSLVEKVHVQVGSRVKKGDPLVEVKSTEVAVAKNECRTKFVQWDHDRKFLTAREPLHKEGRITETVWVETQNAEKKSRLDYLIARDKLAYYGMGAEEIDELLASLSDDRAQKRPAGAAESLATMTIRSTVDGVVVVKSVVPGNYYDMADNLLMIYQGDPQADTALPPGSGQTPRAR